MAGRHRYRGAVPHGEGVAVRRLRSVVLRIAALFGIGRTDAEIYEELESHRALLAIEYERSGMTPDAARRRAARELGSVLSIAEKYRRRRRPRARHRRQRRAFQRRQRRAPAAAALSRARSTGETRVH